MKTTSPTYTPGRDHRSIPEKNKGTLPPTDVWGNDAIPGNRPSGITSYLFIIISMLVLSSVYILFFNIIAEHFRQNSLRKARVAIGNTLTPAYTSIRSDIEKMKRNNASESAMTASVAVMVREFQSYSDPAIHSFFLIGYDGQVIVPVEPRHTAASADELFSEERIIHNIVSARPDREKSQLDVQYIDKTAGNNALHRRIARVTAIPEIHSYIGVRLKFDKIHEEEHLLMSVAKYGSIVILFLFLLPMLYSYIVISRRNRVLNLRNRMMRAIFDNTQQYMMLIDRHNAVIEINNRIIEAFDTAREDVLYKNIKDTPMWNIPSDLRDRITHGFDRAFGGEVVKNIIVSILRKTGNTIQIDFTLSPVTGPDGKVMFVIAEGRDITQQVQAETQLEKSEERYRLTAEASRDALWETDLRTGESYFSDRWYEICKYDRSDFGGLLSQWETVIHPDDFEKAYNIFTRYASGEIEGWMRNEFRIFDKSGILRWILIQGKTLKNDEGVPYRFAGSITDVTEEKVYERKIFELAYYDPATMLPNRAHLYDKLQKMLNAGEQGILFLININNLITVNDIFGYHYGDILLRSMAERIVDALPETKLLGRLSGSDFVAILNAERAKEAMLLAEKLLASLNDPIELQGNKIRVSTNIGIALYPENGTSVTDILKNADAAMHYSRKDGRSRYEIFDRRMTEEIATNLKMENSLHDALVRDEFVLFYQPQVIVRDRSISGFEGLIRWKTTPGFMSPDKFIPLAEETGLIVPMGYGVLSKACAFIRRIESVGTSRFKVSVNISTVQLLQADFVDQVMQIVRNSKVPIDLVGLEITESALMKSYVSNVEKLEELRRNGIAILLDDFGTGYSSLNYLQNLPIDTLKIDKSFVEKIAEHQKARDLAATIISLAHKLGLNVVAEGIETEQQMRILEDNDCDIIQGYLFSKPLPEDLAFDYISPVKPGK